jgi:XTP/dITP diphosphohydrolase
MIRLVIATTNAHKWREIQRVLGSTGAELIGLAALPPVPEPEETGETFEENARLKALYYASAIEAAANADTLVVAEDSGLVVDALDGEPGVRSARFLGAEASYGERFGEIFRRLREQPDPPRTARFVCALAVARRREIVFETVGTIEGVITEAAQGAAGFGYDPIFLYPPFGATLAEVTEDEKLRVAHRGKAFRALAEWVQRYRV